MKFMIAKIARKMENLSKSSSDALKKGSFLQCSYFSNWISAGISSDKTRKSITIKLESSNPAVQVWNNISEYVACGLWPIISCHVEPVQLAVHDDEEVQRRFDARRRFWNRRRSYLLGNVNLKFICNKLLQFFFYHIYHLIRIHQSISNDKIQKTLTAESCYRRERT